MWKWTWIRTHRREYGVIGNTSCVCIMETWTDLNVCKLHKLVTVSLNYGLNSYSDPDEVALWLCGGYLLTWTSFWVQVHGECFTLVFIMLCEVTDSCLSKFEKKLHWEQWDLHSYSQNEWTEQHWWPGGQAQSQSQQEYGLSRNGP